MVDTLNCSFPTLIEGQALPHKMFVIKAKITTYTGFVKIRSFLLMYTPPKKHPPDRRVNDLLVQNNVQYNTVHISHTFFGYTDKVIDHLLFCLTHDTISSLNSVSFHGKNGGH